jgi:hypothetical protein
MERGAPGRGGAVTPDTAADRPVFIVGEARSGTSILYRTLQKHPSFRPREVQLGETEIVANLRRAFLFREDRPRSLVAFMLDDADAYRAFLRSIRAPRVLSAVTAPVNAWIDSPPLWWRRATLHDLVVRRYFLHARRARGCERLVEKTPTNTGNLALLNTAFPRARFLYIHRHPVDVFSSYRRRAAADPDATWARITPPAFCSAYRASLRRAIAWREQRENLAFVRYERFTADPRGTFAEICAFLEEPFDAEAVVERDPSFGRWQGDPHLWAGIVQTTKDWRDHVTPEEARSIEAALAEEMAVLGYAPHVSG